MNVFELVASLRLDKSEYEKGLEDAEGEAGDSGTNMAKSLVGMFKKVVAAAAIGKFVKDSLDAGAALQQSIGGIETLLGTNGQTIEQYAASMGKSVDEVRGKYMMLQQAQETALHNAEIAYKTAGLSANDYMQTVTSFAASLKASGISELEAAEAADKAVIAMADNANKMGTDMSSIQVAYQGFAKQNYTMLDNLKLGYGGTKTEMERLLADAERISGVKYDISNLADVYSAIQVIQDELGITGTTAKEAASTFTGSFAAMQASVQNLMADLAMGNEIDFRPLLESVETFVVNNLVPMVGNIGKALPTLFQGLTEMLPELVDVGKDVLSAVASGIIDTLPVLIESAADALIAFAEALSEPENLEEVLNAAVKIILAIVEGLGRALPKLLAAVPVILMNLALGIGAFLEPIVESGAAIIGALIDGIVNKFFDLVSIGRNIITWIQKGLGDIAEQFKNAGAEVVAGIWEGIKEKFEWIRDKISGVIDTIKGWFTGKTGFDTHSPSKWSEALFSNVMEGMGKGISGGLDGVLANARRAVDDIKDGFALDGFKAMVDVGTRTNASEPLLVNASGGTFAGGVDGISGRPINVSVYSQVGGRTVAYEQRRYTDDESRRVGRSYIRGRG